MINSFLRDIGIYLKENSLLISAPKSTVTLFTQDTQQFQIHSKMTLEATQLPLEHSPKILGVIMDPSLSFHKHYNYVTDRIDKRNNMLKALAGSSWGQDKDTLLLTYNVLQKFIASYAAPIWSTNASDWSFKKIQTAHNAALGTATGAHKIANIDHLHRSPSHWKSGTTKTCSLCSTLWTLSGEGPRLSWHHNSRAKTQSHEGHYPL